MTAEPSLFERIRKVVKCPSDSFMIVEKRIQKVCDKYETSQNELVSAALETCCDLQKRVAELEASNRNMASRLQKLMEKKK